MKTWKQEPESTTEIAIAMTCECGQEAILYALKDPGAAIIGSAHLSVILEPPWHVPPPGWLPHRIECRRCGMVYELEE